MSGPPPPARGGMSLYANLLESNTDSTASITREPVRFKQEEARDGAAKKAIDPALRFQPIRRPQVKQPNKPKPSFPKALAPPTATAATATAPTTTGGDGSTPGTAQQRSTLADWAATEDDEYLYGGGEKRQRGGRRKKRKKMDDVPAETDWDELYDPARPTNVEEYLRSEERIREVREWKAVLYAHRRRRTPSYDSEMGSDEEKDRRPIGNQFAPPASLSFAPPPMSPPRAAVDADAATGDDAYARRLALSKQTSNPPPPPPPPPESNQPPPPPPVTDSTTISRAPVRYEASPPPASDQMDLDSNPSDTEVNYANIPTPPLPAPEDDPSESRSSRPGQAGFAQRLMAKYGWTKGTGLGADATGITSALRVQVEKRRKRPDSEGGGFAEPGGRGKITGGKQGKKPSATEDEEDTSKHGKMSNVIVLQNMLEGMPNLEAEIEAGLGQEIGEECGDKYGRVERLYIEQTQRLVFIKFTDQVSALRAVNDLEGRIFNGNTIVPRFYDLDKFENGVYS
ncbi:hypothetical protein QBC34DRAFT_116751 [Podospora aff. communis PSN243]|uniref:G-patch domain-containing protein n=1 Tax=Podospora aff. communis PSN243 TaxID=3040156 RepID=A0AAV9GLV1_9PEZI|nr:hypothetical protein QBC34DRAFT_116751 [Podospora aff. communis PSN243]